MKVSGRHHAPAALSPGNNPGTHWIGWVDPGAGLKDLKKKNCLPLPGLESRTNDVNCKKLRAFFRC